MNGLSIEISTYLPPGTEVSAMNNEGCPLSQTLPWRQEARNDLTLRTIPSKQNRHATFE